MLLRQLSYAIKNQGLWDEMPPTRGISCLSLVLYGIRLGGFHAVKGSVIGAGVSDIMILSVPTYHVVS